MINFAFYSIKEAADKCEVAESTVQLWIQNNTLPADCVWKRGNGRATLVAKDFVDDFSKNKVKQLWLITERRNWTPKELETFMNVQLDHDAMKRFLAIREKKTLKGNMR
jgi:transposase